nr:hypothetical protein [Pseudonocardia pini]
MDLTDRRLCNRLAHVLAAAMVAVVHGLDPVLDHPPALAVEPAAAELGVEGVEDLGRERSQLDRADQRQNMGPGEVLVGRPGRALHVEQQEMLLQDLADGGRGPWVQLLVDLDQQPS